MARPITPGLTYIQAEVLTLLARGYTGIEIAQELAVPEKTVYSRIEMARKKLGAKTSHQAIAMAISKRLI